MTQMAVKAVFDTYSYAEDDDPLLKEDFEKLVSDIPDLDSVVKREDAISCYRGSSFLDFQESMKLLAQLRYPHEDASIAYSHFLAMHLFRTPLVGLGGGGGDDDDEDDVNDEISPRDDDFYHGDNNHHNPLSNSNNDPDSSRSNQSLNIIELPLAPPIPLPPPLPMAAHNNYIINNNNNNNFNDAVNAAVGGIGVRNSSSVHSSTSSSSTIATTSTTRENVGVDHSSSSSLNHNHQRRLVFPNDASSSSSSSSSSSAQVIASWSRGGEGEKRQIVHEDTLPSSSSSTTTKAAESMTVRPKTNIAVFEQKTQQPHSKARIINSNVSSSSSSSSSSSARKWYPAGSRMQFSASADLTLPATSLIPTPKAVKYADDDDDNGNNIASSSSPRRRTDASRDDHREGGAPDSPKGSIREFQQRYIRPRAYLLPPSSPSRKTQRVGGGGGGGGERADEKRINGADSDSRSNANNNNVSKPSAPSHKEVSSSSSSLTTKDTPIHLGGTSLIGGGILVFLMIVFLAIATHYFINRSYTNVQTCGWIVCKNKINASTEVQEQQQRSTELNQQKDSIDLLKNGLIASSPSSSSSSSSSSLSLNESAADMLPNDGGGADESLSSLQVAADADVISKIIDVNMSSSSTTLAQQSEITSSQQPLTATVLEIASSNETMSTESVTVNDPIPSSSSSPSPLPVSDNADDGQQLEGVIPSSSQQTMAAPLFKPKTKKTAKKACGNPYGLCGMENVPT